MPKIVIGEPPRRLMDGDNGKQKGPVAGGGGGGGALLPPVGGRSGGGDAFSASKQGKGVSAKPILPPGIYRFSGAFYEDRKVFRSGSTGKGLPLQHSRIWDGEFELEIQDEVAGDKGFKGINARLDGVRILLTSAGEGKLTSINKSVPGIEYRITLVPDLKVRKDKLPRFEFHRIKRTEVMGIFSIEALTMFSADLISAPKDPSGYEFQPRDVRFTAADTLPK
jgi:hypothetical protein